MPVSNRRTSIAIGFALALLIPTVMPAQESNDWAQAMFDSLSHDFGVVAKGTQVRHRFKITNTSAADVHIAGVLASCGCTTANCKQPLLKRNESTFVEVSVDTNRFQRQKESTVTVSFDRPRKATVSVEVRAYIRPDIVVTPSSINFGSVPHGKRDECRVSVVYSGRPDWKIEKIVTNDERIQARAVETHRDSGKVVYDLVVVLGPELPLGTYRKQVIVRSNEDNGPQFPISVEASIDADFTVTPSIVQLGTVAPGAEIRKTIVVRGLEPFAVKSIESPSPPGAIKPPTVDDSESRVHVLPLTFIAPRECGEFSRKFVLSISGGSKLEFIGYGNVELKQNASVVR
jgi:Protein of unknown function (DUF1573)